MGQAAKQAKFGVIGPLPFTLTWCTEIFSKIKKINLSEVGFEPTPSLEDQNLSLAP
jgi:hypothetical protein